MRNDRSATAVSVETAPAVPVPLAALSSETSSPTDGRRPSCSGSQTPCRSPGRCSSSSADNARRRRLPPRTRAPWAAAPCRRRRRTALFFATRPAYRAAWRTIHVVARPRAVDRERPLAVRAHDTSHERTRHNRLVALAAKKRQIGVRIIRLDRHASARSAPRPAHLPRAPTAPHGYRWRDPSRSPSREASSARRPARTR